MKALTVVFEPDEDGWWTVTIPSVRGVLTDARSIAEGRRRIRRALSLADDLGWNATKARDVPLLEEIHLPANVRHALAERHAALAELDRVADRFERATQASVRTLSGAGRSLRDIAAILGLSHTRVHQIVRVDAGAESGVSVRESPAPCRLGRDLRARSRRRKR